MPLWDGPEYLITVAQVVSPDTLPHDPGWWWKFWLFTGTLLKPQQGEEEALSPVGHFLASQLPFQPSLRHFIWGCLCFLVLLLGKEGFFWDFFFFLICVHWHFWVTGFFSNRSGRYEAKRTQRTQLSHGSWVLRSLAGLTSLHLLELSCTCLVYNSWSLGGWSQKE